MVSIEEALIELVEIVKANNDNRITFDQVASLAGSLTNTEFYNSVSLKIAQAYRDGSISYTVADGIMNDLWGAVIQGCVDEKSFRIPQPFYKVYEAFDAGEYHRIEDKSDEPVVDYTDPMLDEILRNLQPL